MRKHPLLLWAVAPLCLGLVACTQTTSTDSDAGTETTSSSSSSSSGTPGVSSSSGGSSGVAASSSSAAAASSSAAANSSAAASSSGGGSCPLPEFTLCDGITPETTARTVVTQGDAAKGIAGLVTIGMTRAEVRALLTDEERFVPGENGGASPLPFRAFYCAQQLSVSYGDKADGSGVLAGTLSDDDVVNRITFFGDFAGSTDSGIALGDARSEVSTAYGSNGAVATGLTALDGQIDAYPGEGVMFTHDGTNVTAITVFRAYDGTATPTPMDAALDYEDMEVGGIAAGFIGGSAFSEVRGVFGVPDVEGFANVGGQDIALLGYSNLGLRFVALRDGDQLNTHSVTQVYVTPPYAGVDGAVIGIGSSKSEFDAAFTADGTTDFNGVTLHKYTTGGGFIPPTIAVSFIQDTDCTDVAALIILNWVDAP